MAEPKRKSGLHGLWLEHLESINLSKLDIAKLNETERILSGDPVDLASLLLAYDLKGGTQAMVTRLHRFIYELRKLPASQLGFSLKTPLATLILTLVKRHPAALAACHQDVANVLASDTYTTLCKMSDYACLDASSFLTAVNPKPSRLYRILNLCWAGTYDTRISQAYSSVRTYVAGKKAYTPKDLLFVERVTDQGRCGICTTFSVAAAGHLMDDLIASSANFRIECVSPVVGNHCFTIVNRAGGAKDGIIDPASADWGDDWFVVDAWSASMGYDAFYMGVHEWETMPGFIREHLQGKLNQHFDSSADSQVKNRYAELSKTDVVSAVEKIKKGSA